MKVYIVSEEQQDGGDRIVAVCTVPYVAEEIVLQLVAQGNNNLNEIWEVRVNEVIT